MLPQNSICFTDERSIVLTKAWQELAYQQSVECCVVYLSVVFWILIELLCWLEPNLFWHFYFWYAGPSPGYNHRFYHGFKPEDFIGRMSIVCAAGNNSNAELIGLTRFYLGSLSILISIWAVRKTLVAWWLQGKLQAICYCSCKGRPY